MGTAAILLCCWRHYELAIVMILVSPWINWLLYSNAVKTVDEEESTGTASYIRILLVLLVGLCGLVQFFRAYFTKRITIPNYLIIFGAFICFATLSGFYSIDRKFTLIRSFEFMVFFMFLLGLHTWIDSRKKLGRTLNIYFWVAAVEIIINAAALILWSSRVWAWRMPDRFQGLTDHPNMFGALCMVTYPILIWKYGNTQQIGKTLTMFLLFLTWMLHVLSGSRSSMLASILGGLVWIGCSIKIVTLKRIAIGLSFGLILTLGVSFLLLTKPASLKRGDATITTLTGRTEFWIGCLQLIREKPIQGYGYGVAGKVWEDPRFHREGEFLWAGSAKSSLHNGYLSLAIGLGIIGLAMWLLFLSIPIFKVIWLEPSPYKTFLLMIIVELLVLNFFESALSSGSQIHTSLVFWFILILAGRLPDIVTWQSELKKSYWETDFGAIKTTNRSASLCTGYAST